MMGVKAGMKVLDVGCGVGGPAREIVRFTDANVTGLNNNDYQIDRATQYAAKADLSHKLVRFKQFVPIIQPTSANSKFQNFVKGDFMQMSFEPETFDAVYAIEATVHAPSLEGVYSQIFKVLKPGGVFGVYEWLMTDEYDASNAKHREICHGIEMYVTLLTC